MKKLLLLSSFPFLISFANAQVDTTNQQCLTTDMDTTEYKSLQWFDNNQFLENFLDSIGYNSGASNRIVGAPKVIFWIPIKFWIYRDDNGNGGPNLTHIQRMMDDLNRLYNQDNDTRIGFYMKCDPTYINNSQHLDKTFVGASLLMAANKDDGSINVHVVDKLRFAVGMALAPLNACIVNRNTYLIDQATLAHEVGHILGLVHTHLYSVWGIKCFTESISRTRTWPTFNLCVVNRIKSKRVCESTGDALSDTQADPDLLSNFGCNYILGGSDPWGDSYANPPNGPQERPNTTNIMSYANDACQTQFSRLQTAVMLWTLIFKKTINLVGWANPVSTFDNYEPDNASITARSIVLDETQDRNFHQQWNKIGVYGFTTQCDVDWIRFIPTCNQTVEIKTFEIAGRIKANTKMTIYNASLNQLAQNDNISVINLFSRLIISLSAGQTYFIKVENMSSNVTGYYNLSVSPSLEITGNDAICDGGTYSVPLITGATYLWTVSNSALVNIAATNNILEISRRRSGGGSITITVQISSSCGTITKTKTIQFGAPSPWINGPYDVTQHTAIGQAYINIPYYFKNIQTSTFFPPYSYTWTLFPPTGNPTLYSGNPAYMQFSETGLHTLELATNTECGVSTDIVTIDVQENFSGFRIVTSPNPVVNKILNVSLENEAAQMKLLPQNGNMTVELFHFNTRVKLKQWALKNYQKQFTLNLDNVPKGIYILRVTKGSYHQSSKIVVE